MDIEQAFQQLETINEQLSDETLPLAKAAALFEEGIALSKSLENELNLLENRIEILTQSPENRDELPQFVPFSEADSQK